MIHAMRRCDDCGKRIADSHFGHHLSVCQAPLICLCLIARPDGSGQCVACLRRIAHLMSPDNYRAALEAYPTIGDQAIDWTYRLALVNP